MNAVMSGFLLARSQISDRYIGWEGLNLIGSPSPLLVYFRIAEPENRVISENDSETRLRPSWLGWICVPLKFFWEIFGRC